MPKEKVEKKKSKVGIQSRYWCYTKWGDEDICWDEDTMTYKFSEPEIGEMKGSENKGHHWQGVLIMKKKIRLTSMKKIDSEAHWEKMKGTLEQAKKYCSKENPGKVVEMGTARMCGSGRRNELIKVCDKIKNNINMDTIAEEDPTTYVKFHRGLEKLAFRIGKKEAKKWKNEMKVEIYWGATGTGKTKAAKEAAINGDDYYILDEPESGGIWFDGYDHEGTLIIDEFTGRIKRGKLKRMLDKNMFKCPIKGGYVWAQWNKVIFTSNIDPDKWYQKGLPKSFLRRCPKENWKHFVDENGNDNDENEGVLDFSKTLAELNN